MRWQPACVPSTSTLPAPRPRPCPTPPSPRLNPPFAAAHTCTPRLPGCTMPACRLGLLSAAALLGLLLLGLPPATGTAAEKTGVCPQVTAGENCTQECRSDQECKDNLKCCRAGCTTVCQMPNEKPGSCPQVDAGIPQLGLCVDQCQVDSQCAGQLKCCRNGCGKVSCVTPVF